MRTLRPYSMAPYRKVFMAKVMATTALIAITARAMRDSVIEMVPMALRINRVVGAVRGKKVKMFTITMCVESRIYPMAYRQERRDDSHTQVASGFLRVGE